MKTDFEIQRDVMAELQWEPLLDAPKIGVAVQDGVVTLSGVVDSYSKKLAAETAVKRVSGVKALAEDIQISFLPNHEKTDTEIAEAVVYSLKWNTVILDDKIKIRVEDGVVKLEGEVEWEYQRRNAVRAVENLSGVRSVMNLITVKSKVTVFDVEKKISAAFQRSANIDAKQIKVHVDGTEVVLTGTVRSFAEKDDAEAACWAAPGIFHVKNNLVIEEPEFSFDD